MVGGKKQKKLFIAVSGIGRKQPAFDSGTPDAQIDARLNAITPEMPTVERTRDETRDCAGEFIILEEITSEIVRARYTINATAQLILKFLAYLLGAVLSPTGTIANEVQTITHADADGGTFTWAFPFEGLTDETPALAWNVSAANLKIALENLRSIGAGGITSITGTLATGFIVTFGGKLAKANMPLFVIDSSALTDGGGALAAPPTVAQTTLGSNKVHAISYTTDDENPLLSLIYGFLGDTTSFRKLINCVVERVRIAGTLRGKVTLEVEFIGTRDELASLGAYDVPECVNTVPIYTKDCRVKIGANYSIENLRAFTFEAVANTTTGDDSFAFDSTKPDTLPHGDRTVNITLQIHGQEGDTNHDLADGEEIESVQLIIGKPVERATITLPVGKFRLNGLPFAGDALKSALDIAVRGDVDDANPFPMTVSGNISQTQAFLLTA